MGTLAWNPCMETAEEPGEASLKPVTTLSSARLSETWPIAQLEAFCSTLDGCRAARAAGMRVTPTAAQKGTLYIRLKPKSKSYEGAQVRHSVQVRQTAYLVAVQMRRSAN